MASIPKLSVSRKTGRERSHAIGSARPFCLEDFWQWANSDLVSNATRGILAEYIVARAVGASTDSVRDEWAAYDLETPTGIKIEVKSAAYVQSWYQDRPSAIQFSIKKAQPWNAETNTFGATPTRTADVYVFAVLDHQDFRTIDPLDLAQWRFYAVATATLEAWGEDRKSISLSALRKLASPVMFDALGATVQTTFRRAEDAL